MNQFCLYDIYVMLIAIYRTTLCVWCLPFYRTVIIVITESESELLGTACLIIHMHD